MAQLIVISLKLCLNFAFSQKSQWKMSFSASIPFLSAEETEVTILHSTSLRTQPDCLLVSYSLTSKLFGTSSVSCIDALSLVLLCRALDPGFYDDSNISSTVLVMTYVCGVLCGTRKILNGNFTPSPCHYHL